jgi:3-oxoacyl-[acyl-carrier-protein] synthase-3
MSFYHFNNIKISGIASAIPSNSHSTELQTSSDLGYVAARKLIEEKKIDKNEIGVVIFLTKTPDYRSPASAIVLQHRLQLPIDCLAFDVNIGALGFLVGMQIGCSLLNSLNTQKGLIVIGDTNSKQIAITDSLYDKFGDASAAILIEKKETAMPIYIQTFSSGNNYDAYMIAGGAFRTNDKRKSYNLTSVISEGSFNELQYNIQRMSAFFSEKIPVSLMDFLLNTKSNITSYQEVLIQQTLPDLLNKLALSINIEPEKLVRHTNNNLDYSGCSIPLMLSNESSKKRILTCAYGEGLSWGFADFSIENDVLIPTLFSDEFYTNGHVTHDI